MKQERKFRFVGDPKEYVWPMVEVDRVYNGDLYVKSWGLSVQEAALEHPEDWEEVTEQEQIPNQDQPASEMTKFEMAVLGNLKGIISNPNTAHQITAALGNNVDADTADKAVVSKAIKLAKETFKKLENLKK